MAHYSYKEVCYDIDFEKWKSLVDRFEKQYDCKYDGDPNYDGDSWYIAAMWIEELIAENKALKAHSVKQLSDDDIDRCAYKTGMWCDGTPDEWDLEAIRNFARAIIKEITE